MEFFYCSKSIEYHFFLLSDITNWNILSSRNIYVDNAFKAIDLSCSKTEIDTTRTLNQSYFFMNKYKTVGSNQQQRTFAFFDLPKSFRLVDSVGIFSTTKGTDRRRRRRSVTKVVSKPYLLRSKKICMLHVRHMLVIKPGYTHLYINAHMAICCRSMFECGGNAVVLRASAFAETWRNTKTSQLTRSSNYKFISLQQLWSRHNDGLTACTPESRTGIEKNKHRCEWWKTHS